MNKTNSHRWRTVFGCLPALRMAQGPQRRNLAVSGESFIPVSGVGRGSHASQTVCLFRGAECVVVWRGCVAVYVCLYMCGFDNNIMFCFLQ